MLTAGGHADRRLRSREGGDREQDAREHAGEDAEASHWSDGRVEIVCELILCGDVGIVEWVSVNVGGRECGEWEREDGARSRAEGLLK